MQPEMKKIQDKYKNRKDEASMMAMNQETQAVYAKYGVSPSGSCVQLLIQMPILFALYRVIYSMPAYVTKFGDALGVLADKIMATEGGVDYVKGLDAAVTYVKNFEIEGNTRNAIIDTLVAAVKMYPLNFDITLSFGIYIAENSEYSVRHMLDRAGVAQKATKNNYKSHVSYFDEALKEQEEIEELNPARIILSPGPGKPENAGIGGLAAAS